MSQALESDSFHELLEKEKTGAEDLEGLAMTLMISFLVTSGSAIQIIQKMKLKFIRFIYFVSKETPYLEQLPTIRRKISIRDIF